MIFRRRRKLTAAEQFAAKFPFGEEGSVEYWIEAMKRAYEAGCPEALPEMERLSQLTGLRAPTAVWDFPKWFQDAWLEWLAPYHRYEHPLAMPY